jgi:Predicted transporter component
MVSDKTDLSSRSLLLTSVVILALVTIVAVITRLWVLTAIPIGFLFGFFLEKADLCGASAFSEIILMRDLRKFQGLLVVIVISMVGFSLLDALDLVHLNPFPFFWASSLVGGVIFGIGMVLAGGCISGCLFKTGQGNMNSLAALVAIPLGAAAVEYGPLHRIHTALRQKVLYAPDGGPLTLSSVTELSYQTLAVIFLVVTIVVALIISTRKKKPQGLAAGIDKKSFFRRILRGPWKPWQAGIAIGILASLAYLSSAASGRNYPLGTTYGVLYAELLFTDHPLTYVWTNLQKEPAPVQSTRQHHRKLQSPTKRFSCG